MKKIERQARSPHELAEMGNQFIAEIGRKDVHWIVRNGRCVIEFKARPSS